MATAHRSQMLSDDQAEWHEAALVVSEKLEQPGVRPTAGHGECELDVGTPSTISNPMQSAPTKDAELRWKETAGRDPPSYTPPNRDMARAHFKDHRPRRIKDSKQPTGHRRAKQREKFGENGEPSIPYDFFQTSDDALDEFGAGVSLYFKSLKALALVFLLCAFVSLLAVYENKKHQFEKETSMNAVDVPTYNNSTRQNLETPLRMLGSVYGVIRSDLKFYKQGISDVVVTVILVIVAFTGYLVERRAVKRIDEQQLTTKDYAVVVSNPPPQITDPNVYHRHFSQFGEVVFVSIVKNNGNLVRKISNLKDKQRLCLGLSSAQQSPKSVPLLIRHVTAILEYLSFCPSLDALKVQIDDLKKEITILTSVKYKPNKVYIVFNSENSRKNCIYDTAVSERTVWRNSIGQNSSSVLGGFVLKVKNAPEPGDLIYEYSDAEKSKIYLTLAASYSLTALVLGLSYGIIQYLIHHTGHVPVAIAVSLMNAGLPQAVQFITFLCEIHDSEIDVQKSTLSKLLVARCVNSALLLYMVTPYRETFSLESLERIQNILLADAIATPVFRLTNPFDIGMRYIVAPLSSATQAQYNKFWMGAQWNLAERYSDVLKSVFVGVFFAPLLPSGYFMTAFAIILTYLVDKYSLYYIWRKVPSIGPDVAYLARYFYFVTVLCHLQFALIFFANWPYRGVFEAEKSPQAECGFLRCSVTDAMTDDQADLVTLYSISTAIAFAVLCFWGLPYRLFKFGKKVFYPYRKDKTANASEVPFRSLLGVNTYIPTVKRGAYLTPYIVAQISNTPKKYIPLHLDLKWEDLPDPREFSVFNRMDFVHIPDDQLRRAVSTVTYYGVDDDISAEIKLRRSFHQPVGGILPLYDSIGEGDYGIEMLPPISSVPTLRKQKSTRLDCNGDEELCLPTGWEKRQAPDDEIYYIDNNTNITHWVPPVTDSSVPHFLEGRGSIFLSSKSLGADIILEERLSLVSVSTNTWHRASTGGIEDQFHLSSSNQLNFAILPFGWEEMFTPDGLSYFVDHNTRTNQWTLPEQIKELVHKTAAMQRKSV